MIQFLDNQRRLFYQYLIKFLDGRGVAPKNNRLVFGGDPDPLPLLSPDFSRFQWHNYSLLLFARWQN